MRQKIWILAVIAGCSGTRATDTAAGGDDTEGTAPDPTVMASIQVLDPMDGGGWMGITVTGGADDVQTESGGVADVEVTAEESFSLALTADGILDHVLYGTAGAEDFELITFAGSPSTSSSVLGMLGLSWQPDAGMVVVGADYDDWSAVAGAQVSVSDSDAQAFVLGAGGMPALGDTIPTGGMGMVSFANIRVGEVTVELTPPDGVSCAPHPGGEGYGSVPVLAETVTVISYRCEGSD
jgi:hypothetical protein